MFSMTSARPTKLTSLSPGAATLDEIAPRRVLWQHTVPLLLSISSIGLVTAALLALTQTLATSLVPIAYLIPVMFAATRWGVWPAMAASITAATAGGFAASRSAWSVSTASIASSS